MEEYKEIDEKVKELEEYVDELILYVNSAFVEVSEKLLLEVRAAREELEEAKIKLEKYQNTH